MVILAHIGPLRDSVRLTEIPAQILSGTQINSAAAEDRRWLTLHACDNEESRHVSGLEIYQDVDIAVGTEIVPQHGAEKSETPDMVLTAKGC